MSWIGEAIHNFLPLAHLLQESTMSRSDGHTNRRTLSFEDLEAKTSLTNVVGFAGCVDASNVPAVIRQARGDELGDELADELRETRAVLLLRYVASMDDIEVERSLPGAQDASDADTRLGSNRPTG